MKFSLMLGTALEGAARFLGLLSRFPSRLTSLPVPALVFSSSSKVDFSFAVTDIRGRGLSRTITAEITNTGKADAHNVWAEVEVFSEGSRIGLGGDDSLRINMGTVKAGETVQRQASLSLNVMDGLKVSGSGAVIKLTIKSDEYTKDFSYDYSP